MILLAEDSEDDVLVFKRMLGKSKLGNPLMVVRNGEEAIAYLKGEGQYANREQFPLPKVLLLDLAMPKVNGWDVLAWIKTQPDLEDLLIVVLTGSGQVGEMQRAYRAGAKSFLSKPCRTEDLANLADAFPQYWIHTPLAPPP